MPFPVKNATKLVYISDTDSAEEMENQPPQVHHRSQPTLHGHLLDCTPSHQLPKGFTPIDRSSSHNSSFHSARSTQDLASTNAHGQELEEDPYVDIPFEGQLPPIMCVGGVGKISRAAKIYRSSKIVQGWLVSVGVQTDPEPKFRHVCNKRCREEHEEYFRTHHKCTREMFSGVMHLAHKVTKSFHSFLPTTAPAVQSSTGPSGTSRDIVNDSPSSPNANQTQRLINTIVTPTTSTESSPTPPPTSSSSSAISSATTSNVTNSPTDTTGEFTEPNPTTSSDMTGLVLPPPLDPRPLPPARPPPPTRHLSHLAITNRPIRTTHKPITEVYVSSCLEKVKQGMVTRSLSKRAAENVNRLYYQSMRKIESTKLAQGPKEGDSTQGKGKGPGVNKSKSNIGGGKHGRRP